MQEEISLPVRSCLRRGEDTYLLLIDDLESSGRASVEEIFKNYRRAVDLLLAAEEKSRTAVFFLVNMLEAYFFADPEAIHRALGIQAEISVGDVEKIRNPKSRLAMQYPGYRETEDGGRILEQLDLFKVLENPKHCAWLRSCIDWVYRSLSRDLAVELQDSLENIEQACHLQDGRKSIQTSAQ